MSCPSDFYYGAYPTLSSPLLPTLYTALAFAFLTFVISTITSNVSQVDKLWSIVPFVYALMSVNSDRTALMAVVATTWGIRLSYNFGRRGGYTWPLWSGEEDYRWPLLRSGTLPGFGWCRNPVLWTLFNLVFISFYQMLLLWLIATPFVVAAVGGADGCAAPLGAVDYLFALLIFAALLLETIADDSQYYFQTEKHRLISGGARRSGDFQNGFKTTGLYSLVRKPNYLCEQAVWVLFYLWGCAATGDVLRANWSGIGCLLLIGLFQGSGKMTEDITQRKYPKYAEYKKRVGLYNPIYTLIKSGMKRD